MPDLGLLFQGMFVIICLSMPLALWKLIDIVIWIFNHVSVSWE